MNHEKVGRILDQHGWLPRSEIGEKAALALFLVVQQGYADMGARDLPQLHELARRGEATTVHAAMMEDRLLMDRGQEQIYGSQSREGLIWPIRDVGNVDQRRREAGFCETRQEYARSLNATFEPGLRIEDMK